MNLKCSNIRRFPAEIGVQRTYTNAGELVLLFIDFGAYSSSVDFYNNQNYYKRKKEP
jgi:hypothetical protein